MNEDRESTLTPPRSRMTAAKLTPQRKKFCREYVKDFNGTRSSIAAGYSINGAAVQASRLLNDVNVQGYLSKLVKKAAEKDGLSAESVIERINDLAKACAKIVDGRPVDASNANRSLENLAKYLRLWTEKIDLSVTLKDAKEYAATIAALIVEHVSDKAERDALLEAISAEADDA